MVSSSSFPNPRVCFGDFAVDLEAGELYRNGQKVKLQGQPFQILVVLLKQPGRIVTREELHQQLWSTDTFVDFEHGLNAAVNRLREALRDSAEEPRFIETVPPPWIPFCRGSGKGSFTGASTTWPEGVLWEEWSEMDLGRGGSGNTHSAVRGCGTAAYP